MALLSNLKPFFSYFGSKNSLAPKYPIPRFDIIVEPFAGSAGYSLYYSNKQVILFDKNPKITSLWQYLINKATEDEILKLPIRSFNKEKPLSRDEVPCQEAMDLIGFWLTPCQARPSVKQQSPARPSLWSEKLRERIANQLKYIRHWKVYPYSYGRIDDIIGNIEATWYIDPPYQEAGKHYNPGFKNKNICFEELAGWCQERNGQVIVCEAMGADWLPFKRFIPPRQNMKNKSYEEVIWTNE